MSWFCGVVFMALGVGPVDLSVRLHTSSLPAALKDVPSPFTEEAIERGIGPYVTGMLSGGYGVALLDLNNTGHADLLACGEVTGVIGLWRNDGTGYFENRTDASGIPPLPQAAAFGIGDFDGDGLLDVVISRRYWNSTRLFRNLGDYVFEDVTDQAGIDNILWGEHAAFGDYNGDGWLDLYIANFCITTADNCATGRNHFYENQGNGTFTEIAEQLGIDDRGQAWHAFFYDFNRNGYPDIYVSNDKGHLALQLKNKFYRNTGGAFTDISETSNTDYAAYSMGVGVGDFSRTGWDDIYCTNIGLSGYMIHHGDYKFTPHAASDAGIPNMGYGWAAPMFDFNNNGLIDLYVCNLSHFTADNRLYQNMGDQVPIEVAEAYGVHVPVSSATIAMADLTGNGAIDFVHSGPGDRLRLFVNHEGSKRNWIKFRVNGIAPNVFAIGAMVDIRVGDTWQHRQLSGGNDYKGANHFILHFGLGDAALVDEVIIRWPAHTPAQVTLSNLPANQMVTVDHPLTRPTFHPADLNLDGLVNGFDLLVLLAAWGQCPAPPIGCPADFNGDGYVNGFDLLYLLGNWG